MPTLCVTYPHDAFFQASNAIDLRKCNFAGADLYQRALAGAFLVETDMSGANLKEAVLTKASTALS